MEYMKGIVSKDDLLTTKGLQGKTKVFFLLKKVASGSMSKKILLLVCWFLVLCATSTAFAQKEKNNMSDETSIKTVVFAAGCFWCIEPPFDKEAGVIKTTAGYTGGSEETATYKQVSSGSTSHREVMQVVYDSKIVSFSRLLEIFWENVDPFDAEGQFCDKGFQYTSAVYYNDDAEKRIAEESIPSALEKASKKEKDKEVATSIEEAKPFYAAEDYHQDYYKLNPYRYKTYRYFCGRDARLSKVWPSRSKK